MRERRAWKRLSDVGEGRDAARERLESGELSEVAVKRC